MQPNLRLDRIPVLISCRFHTPAFHLPAFASAGYVTLKLHVVNLVVQLGTIHEAEARQQARLMFDSTRAEAQEQPTARERVASEQVPRPSGSSGSPAAPHGVRSFLRVMFSYRTAPRQTRGRRSGIHPPRPSPGAGYKMLRMFQRAPPASRLCFLVAPFLCAFLLLHYARTPDRSMAGEGMHDVGEMGQHKRFLDSDVDAFDVKTTMHQFKTDASVAGSNIDHNGSVSNLCLTARPLLRRTLLEDPPTPFRPFGLHSFVLRSSYRLSSNSFVALGLSLLSLHETIEQARSFSEQAKRCMWIAPDGTSIAGRIYTVWPGETHGLTYESIILRCQLQGSTQPKSGGALFMNIGGEQYSVYRESPGAPLVDPEAPPKYSLGFCSFPLYRGVSASRLGQWLQFSYRSLGVEYFVINDGGSVDDETMKVLSPYLKTGMMEVTDIRGQFLYESKHNVLTLNDCLYKMRPLAHWSLVLDFDEFLYIKPPQTLKTILQQHADAPFLTFGSLWWAVMFCRAPTGKGQWPIERMSFHWPMYYCEGREYGYPRDLCLNYYGHRKYVVNPRKVWTVEVHRPVEPIDGGVHLNASEVWINHFQGILRDSQPVCTKPVRSDETKPENWWVEDKYLAEEARKAREKGPPREWLGSRI